MKKTILNKRCFMRNLKLECGYERITQFYNKCVIAKLFSIFKDPIVFMPGYYGDEIFDSIYMALRNIGIYKSPYDFVEIHKVMKKNNRIGLKIIFKDISTAVSSGEKAS